MDWMNNINLLSDLNLHWGHTISWFVPHSLPQEKKLVYVSSIREDDDNDIVFTGYTVRDGGGIEHWCSSLMKGSFESVLCNRYINSCINIEHNNSYASIPAALYINKTPNRQWRKSLSASSHEVHYSNYSGVIPYDGVSIHAGMLPAILKEYPSVEDAVHAVTAGTAMSISFNNNLALSIHDRTEDIILLYKNSIVGLLDEELSSVILFKEASTLLDVISQYINVKDVI